MVLIAATAAVFGPWLGIRLCAASACWRARWSLTSSARRLGRDALRRCSAPRWRPGAACHRPRGLLAIVAIRLVPVAPFTPGQPRWRARAHPLLDFLAGTLIGMLPGLIADLGDGRPHHRIAGRAERSAGLSPSWSLCVAGWLALAWCAQALVGRVRGARVVSGRSGHTVRVMTWNIHGARRPQSALRPRARRRADRSDTIPISSRCRRSIRAAPREARCRRSVRGPAGGARQPRHRRQDHRRPTDGEYGQALISRWPMAQHRDPRHVVSRSASRAAPSAATIETPGGPLRVIATHLGLSFRERRSQAEALLEDAGRACARPRWRWATSTTGSGPARCGRFLRQGFRRAAGTGRSPQCSPCSGSTGCIAAMPRRC